MQETLAETMRRFLGCPVTVFPRKTSHEDLVRAYDEALGRGRAEGFVPVIILADELMWTALKAQFEGPGADESLAFDPEAVRKQRLSRLEQPLPDAQMVLAEREAMAAELEDEEEEGAFLEEDNEDWQTAGPEDERQASAAGRLSGLMQIRLEDDTASLLLAEIPVEHPWQVFAWIPFGGWNEAPSPEEVMAVSRHWYELYRARPAVIGFDSLEFDLPEPIRPEQAQEVLQDHLAFAPEFFSLGMIDESILAHELSEMESWYFWWD